MASGDQQAGTARPTALDRLAVIRDEVALLTRELSDALPAEDGDDIALEALARGILWQRAIIAEHLDPDFGDPASNILLSLFAAGREGVLTAGACCEAAQVPRTTALRWISILEDRGLVRSLIDQSDKRRTSIGLSATGRITMRRCLIAIANAPRTGLAHP